MDKLKSLIDVQTDILARGLNAEASSTNDQTPNNQSSAAQASDASDVKQKAGEQDDVSSDKAAVKAGSVDNDALDDKVSSYNRLREAQRKYDKAIEKIEELEKKLGAKVDESKNVPLTAEQFKAMYEEDPAKAILFAIQTHAQTTERRFVDLLQENQHINKAMQQQYMEVVKDYPQLQNLADPFTQEVDAELKKFEQLGIKDPSMIRHAAEAVYGRRVKAGLIPVANKVQDDEKARLARIAQGQIAGRGFGASLDNDLELSEDQIAYAKKLGIDPTSNNYKKFVRTNFRAFKYRG